MAANYEQFKQAWNKMDNAQKKQYTEQYKNDSTFQQFAQQYNNEYNWGSVNVNEVVKQANNNQWVNNTTKNNYSSNSNSSNGTNWYNGNNNSDLNNWYNNNNKWGSTLSDGKNGDGNTYWKFTFDADEFLDKSKFWESTGKIEVKEWSAAINQRPDYTLDTDARLQEMVNNLNTYWQTNPEFFSDRETFNRQFEYNSRESDAQRALLDSYWKKAQEYKKATSYNNWSSFASDLSSWYVSESDFEALKQYNQKAYIEWQEKMQEQLNLAISNLTIPRSIDNITDALNTLVEKFNLQAGDPYNIIQGWEDMMQRTWAWDAMNQATKLYEEANSDIAKIKEIQQRYSSSTWWTQSDALIAARLQKATLPYETSLSNKLSAWQHWQSLYQTKLGTANQYAQTIQMQAQEDQRIFQDKLSALWFAVTAYTTRTPEQQAQLSLQTAQIQNDMSLLQQSKLNDLSLYNQYATAKLNNQLNYELTDLTTTDPKQLRANLKNVLDPYYEKFWDIIERSESQVIEDVIALAKEKWISVAEALRENFTKQLMAKPEYKNYIKSNYAAPENKYQNEWKVEIDADWNTKTIYTWYWDLPENITKSSLISSLSNWYNDLNTNAFISSLAWLEGKQWLWCWEFVNSVLSSMWDSTWFWNSLKDKEKVCNRKAEDWPVYWAAVVLDTWVFITDEDKWYSYNAGHVGIITGMDNNWVYITDSNWDWNKTVSTHYMTYDKLNSICKWYYVSPKLEQETNQYWTPMNDVFNRWYKNATTDWAKETLAAARTMYETFYDLNNEYDENWNTYMEHFLLSPDFEKFVNNMDAEVFWNSWEDNWAAFYDYLVQWGKNANLDPINRRVMNQFEIMINKNLRLESWAAISSSEWRSKFMTMIPQAWMPDTFAYKQLQNWDKEILNSLYRVWIDNSSYIPLYSDQFISNRMANIKSSNQWKTVYDQSDAKTTSASSLFSIIANAARKSFTN